MSTTGFRLHGEGNHDAFKLGGPSDGDGTV
jgi:hypothetical protein